MALTSENMQDMFINKAQFVQICVCLFFIVICSFVQASEVVNDPLTRSAVMIAHPEKTSFLLGIARAGERLIAAGERGIILVSEDQGTSWKQVPVPLSVTLTSIHFIDDKLGWATGHSGVVLNSKDGGDTWSVQLDGNQAASLYKNAILSEASKLPKDDKKAKWLRRDAERMELDGPDKPFLDVHFEDENRGYVVGAYNLAFVTEDGGTTWRCFSGEIDNPRAMHLYAIAVENETLFMAGEQGLFLASSQSSGDIERIDTPYEGSYFRMSQRGNSEIILSGLRGNVYKTISGGEHWDKLESPSKASFTAAAVKGNRLYLGNEAGQIFVNESGKSHFDQIEGKPLPPVTGIVILDDDTLVITSVHGIHKIRANTINVGTH